MIEVSKVMMKKIVFILEEPNTGITALRKRCDALSQRLIAFTSRDVRGIENDFTLASAKNASQIYHDLKNRNDLATTLFATNLPALASEIIDDGAYCIGLIEGSAREEDFPTARYLFAEFDEVEEDSYVKAYQRLAGEPWSILETERTYLRETCVEDVDAFYEIYKEPKITQYMEGLFTDPEDEKRYTRDYIEKVYGLMGYGVWTVIDKATDAIIGRAGLSLRGGFTDAELGFLIAVPYQGRGYATEVITAILAYAKNSLGFDQVQALVKDDNTESIHLLTKCGFAPAEEVSIEEGVYGNDYTGERVNVLSDITFGTYLQMKKIL